MVPKNEDPGSGNAPAGGANQDTNPGTPKGGDQVTKEQLDKIEQQNRDLQAQLTESQQKLSNAENILTNFVNSSGSQSNVPDYGRKVPDQPNQDNLDDAFTAEQKEMLKKRELEIENRLRSQYVAEQQSRTTREKFYSKNPGLVGSEIVVQGIAQQVESSKPYLKGDALLDEIAKESTAWLAKIKVSSGQSGPPAMHVVDGSGVQQTPTPEDAAEKPKSEAETFNDAIAERKEVHSKTIQPLG